MTPQALPIPIETTTSLCRASLPSLFALQNTDASCSCAQSAFDPVYPFNPAHDSLAYEIANKARDIWHAGDAPWRKRTAYLNYAAGDETVEQLYGHESWRLEKLRALKKKYDPKGKFGFYNPIR